VKADLKAAALRLTYTVLSYLLAPLVLLFLLWRGFGNHGYWGGLGERMGRGRARAASPSLWVHAVSVGEVQAAVTLVNGFMQRYPDVPVMITTMTPTGQDRAMALFGDKVLHSFVPYDLPSAVRRFFDRAMPRLAIIMETEIWPNLYHECGRRQVPLVMANARVSARSVRLYKILVELFRKTLSHGIVIAAQSDQDAQRFLSIGSNPARTHVMGNIKFDFELQPGIVERGEAFRATYIADRPVWVAASTHEGEEELVLQAHKAVRQRHPDAVLLLVPRHPERFDAVAAMVEHAGFRCRRRSAHRHPDRATDVFLVDTLGELMMFYAASDVAFVAGSLVPIGGHNLLEPASLGVPIVTGPYNFNAQDVADLFLEAGAMRVAPDPAALADAVANLLSDPAQRQALVTASEGVLSRNRGTLDRLMELLEPLLEERFGPPVIEQSPTGPATR